MGTGARQATTRVCQEDRGTEPLPFTEPLPNLGLAATLWLAAARPAATLWLAAARPASDP